MCHADDADDDESDSSRSSDFSNDSHREHLRDVRYAPVPRPSALPPDVASDEVDEIEGEWDAISADDSRRSGQNEPLRSASSEAPSPLDVRERSLMGDATPETRWRMTVSVTSDTRTSVEKTPIPSRLVCGAIVFAMLPSIVLALVSTFVGSGAEGYANEMLNEMKALREENRQLHNDVRLIHSILLGDPDAPSHRKLHESAPNLETKLDEATEKSGDATSTHDQEVGGMISVSVSKLDRSHSSSEKTIGMTCEIPKKNPQDKGLLLEMENKVDQVLSIVDMTRPEMAIVSNKVTNMAGEYMQMRENFSANMDHVLFSMESISRGIEATTHESFQKKRIQLSTMGSNLDALFSNVSQVQADVATIKGNMSEMTVKEAQEEGKLLGMEKKLDKVFLDLGKIQRENKQSSVNQMKTTDQVLSSLAGLHSSIAGIIKGSKSDEKLSNIVEALHDVAAIKNRISDMISKGLQEKGKLSEMDKKLDQVTLGLGGIQTNNSQAALLEKKLDEVLSNQKKLFIGIFLTGFAILMFAILKACYWVLSCFVRMVW